MATKYRFLSIGASVAMRRAGSPVPPYAPELRIMVGEKGRAVAMPLTERDLLQIMQQATTALQVLARERGLAPTPAGAGGDEVRE